MTEALHIGVSPPYTYDRIEHAMNRLDGLWDGNDFDKGDKMRVNQVRYDLRMIKTILLEQEE